MSFIPGEVTTRLIINIFSHNLLVGIPSSLTTIRLNLINNATSAFTPIGFSQVKFHFEL